MADKAVRRNAALRDSWFAAAYEILASQGYGALKLAALCEKVGVTTGSFYHSFDNWQDFTDSLLSAWLTDRTDATIALAHQSVDPAERIGILIQATENLMHRTEAAIRVWAGVDPKVAAIQRQVDQSRFSVLHEGMCEIVGPELADQFAVWGLSTVIGYEMVADTHPIEHLLWSIRQIFAAAQQAGRAT